MTRSDLQATIIYTLTEGNAPGFTLDDFDIDGIVDACHAATGSYDLDDVPSDQFWSIVATHNYTQRDTVDASGDISQSSGLPEAIIAQLPPLP